MRGRAATVAHRHKRTPIGFDYVHTAVDDHSRYAYAEVLPDETGASTAALLLRAAQAFAAAGIPAIERVISDNAMNYRHSAAFGRAVAAIGARQKFIRPHCPWTNGKARGPSPIYKSDAVIAGPRPTCPVITSRSTSPPATRRAAASG